MNKRTLILLLLGVVFSCAWKEIIPPEYPRHPVVTVTQSFAYHFKK